MSEMSRREFAALIAAGAASGRADPLALERHGALQSVTAQDIVERIRRNIGVEWRTDTVDTVKAGDPAIAVRGIATTAMATLAVLQQATKAGANLVITCEPTFYGRADGRNPPSGRGGRGAGGSAASVPGENQAGMPPPAAAPPDRVFAVKNDTIATNNLVVFRLSDHWRLRRPDPFAEGLASALGWTGYQVADDPLRFAVPAVSLGALAGSLRKALSARGGIRVVGDPTTAVQRVALLPGSTPIQASLNALPGVDVIIAGEVREWESVEYARDAAFSGRKKGLILVGRVLSEEPGMAVCAAWMKTVVPEVPVRHIPAGDPYWRPA
jgi:hypothetical protein